MYDIPDKRVNLRKAEVHRQNRQGKVKQAQQNKRNLLPGTSLKCRRGIPPASYHSNIQSPDIGISMISSGTIPVFIVTQSNMIIQISLLRVFMNTLSLRGAPTCRGDVAISIYRLSLR
jgi:hypothetical protein